MRLSACGLVLVLVGRPSAPRCSRERLCMHQTQQRLFTLSCQFVPILTRTIAGLRRFPSEPRQVGHWVLGGLAVEPGHCTGYRMGLLRDCILCSFFVVRRKAVCNARPLGLGAVHPGWASPPFRSHATAPFAMCGENVVRIYRCFE